jgi:hypothetical protein
LLVKQVEGKSDREKDAFQRFDEYAALGAVGRAECFITFVP